MEFPFSLRTCSSTLSLSITKETKCSRDLHFKADRRHKHAHWDNEKDFSSCTIIRATYVTLHVESLWPIVHNFAHDPWRLLRVYLMWGVQSKTSNWECAYIFQSQSQVNASMSNAAIQNMEQVRSHLHSMLNMTKEALPGEQILT